MRGSVSDPCGAGTGIRVGTVCGGCWVPIVESRVGGWFGSRAACLGLCKLVCVLGGAGREWFS